MEITVPEVNPNPEPEDEVIVAGTGEPYKTEKLAISALDKKGLDPKKFQVVPHEEGFGIVRKPDTGKKEKFYWVEFNQRQNPEEEEDVILGVNGEFLVCQRAVRTIIPERYKECADHTTKPVFRQMPNQARLQVGTVQLYPYSLYGEATEEEYLHLKAEGTRRTREELAANRKLVE
jgi:hypothetical protein